MRSTPTRLELPAQTPYDVGGDRVRTADRDAVGLDLGGDGAGRAQVAQHRHAEDLLPGPDVAGRHAYAHDAVAGAGTLVHLADEPLGLLAEPDGEHRRRAAALAALAVQQHAPEPSAEQEADDTGREADEQQRAHPEPHALQEERQHHERAEELPRCAEDPLVLQRAGAVDVRVVGPAQTESEHPPGDEDGHDEHAVGHVREDRVPLEKAHARKVGDERCDDDDGGVRQEDPAAVGSLPAGGAEPLADLPQPRCPRGCETDALGGAPVVELEDRHDPSSEVVLRRLDGSPAWRWCSHMRGTEFVGTGRFASPFSQRFTRG
jgi:hypothetical protein